MKHQLNRRLLFVALLLGMVFQMAAQNTYVHVTIFLNDGTEETYDMLNSSYMYFEEGVRLVITEPIDGMTAVSYPLSDIRKITCQELEGTAENLGTDMAFFPNPTHNQVTFRNIRGKQMVKIYALDGCLIKTFQVTDNQTVDISALPAGLYLVNISSNIFKMMKL